MMMIRKEWLLLTCCFYTVLFGFHLHHPRSSLTCRNAKVSSSDYYFEYEDLPSSTETKSKDYLPFFSAREEKVLAERNRLRRDILKIERRLYQRLGRQPSHDEVASLMGIQSENLRKMMYLGRMARKKLTKNFAFMVKSIAKEHYGRGISYVDLVEEGSLGLLKAIDKFDTARGTRLSTVANMWINQGIKRSLGNKSRLVRLPVEQYTELGKMQNFIRDFRWNNDRNPSRTEVAAHLKIHPSKIDVLLKHMPSNVRVDEIRVHDKSSARQLSLRDMLTSSSSSTVREKENDLYLQMTILKTMKECLSEREEDILWKLTGLYDGRQWSTKELGDMWDVSFQRINQIKEKAMIKLGKHLDKAPPNYWEM